jgi:hypothetical protein
MDGHCVPGVVPRRDANARDVRGSRRPQRTERRVSTVEWQGVLLAQPFRCGSLSATFAGCYTGASLSRGPEQEDARQAPLWVSGRWLSRRIRAATAPHSPVEA